MSMKLLSHISQLYWLVFWLVTSPMKSHKLHIVIILVLPLNLYVLHLLDAASKSLYYWTFDHTCRNCKIYLNVLNWREFVSIFDLKNFFDIDHTETVVSNVPFCNVCYSWTLFAKFCHIIDTWMFGDKHVLNDSVCLDTFHCHVKICKTRIWIFHVFDILCVSRLVGVFSKTFCS